MKVARKMGKTESVFSNDIREGQRLSGQAEKKISCSK